MPEHANGVDVCALADIEDPGAKGFVIEQALLHHMEALAELPEEVVIPPRLVVDQATGARILQRIDTGEPPNAAMRELFEDDPDVGRD